MIFPGYYQNKPSIFAAVFLNSVSVLLYELVQIRIFSYSLSPILTYTAISLAMLGFGIGAMLLSLFPAFFDRQFRQVLPALAGLQAMAMVGSSAVFALSSQSSVLALKASLTPLIVNVLIPCTMPYVFGGCFLALIFSSAPAHIGKNCLFNLIGGGIGSLLFTLLLTPLGAPRLVALAAVFSALSALLVAWPGRRLYAIGGGILVIALGGFFGYAERALQFKPDPTDFIGFAKYLSDQGKISPLQKEFDKWNIVGRIEIWAQPDSQVTAPEKTAYRILTVDSGATTVLMADPGTPHWGSGLFEETFYGLAYRVSPNPEDVLVIGAGGGTDVQAALHFGARKIYAVEINAATIDALKGPFRSFLKWPLARQVSHVHADGRSFSKSMRGRFDVIQLTGVDTLTIYTTGAFHMVEDSLYTVEAFKDYIAALKPDGVLSVVRFGDEHLRLTELAIEALLQSGIEHPERHIAAFKQSITAAIVVSKRPLSESALDALDEATKRKTSNNVSVPIYNDYGLALNKPLSAEYLPGRSLSTAFRHYYSTTFNGQKEHDNQLGKISIATDDRPFYMFSSWINGPKHGLFSNYFEILKRFWSAIVLLALVLIVLPVLVFGRSLTWPQNLFWVFPYFFLIGLGFMMLEVVIINRFSVFVGSPGASTAVVLTALLIASGFGSYMSEFLSKKPETRITIATAALIAFSLMLKFLTPHIFDYCWSAGLGQPARAMVAGLMVVPMGWAMGWFFPVGLRIIGARLADYRLMPWAISINGFASVLGSVVALPLSIFKGFSHVFLFALAGYFIAGGLSYIFFSLKKGTA